MTTQPTVRVYYGFRSPYSRFGLHLIQRAGLDAELIPFTGPPAGSPFQDPAKNPAKINYLIHDAPRIARRMDLQFMFPDPVDVDFRPANKAAEAASQDGKGLAFAVAVSDARWGDGQDISNLAVLETCAETAGWDPQKVAIAASDEAMAEAIKAQRTLIEQDQVFGVPFFVVGDQRYWGHDRVSMMLEDLGLK
ncbi:MAG: DsbA family protein [Pseudomonadota bacterium]